MAGFLLGVARPCDAGVFPHLGVNGSGIHGERRESRAITIAEGRQADDDIFYIVDRADFSSADAQACFGSMCRLCFGIEWNGCGQLLLGNGAEAL